MDIVVKDPGRRVRTVHAATRTILTLAFALLLMLISNGRAQTPPWPQWGGPNRNFNVETKGLAASWPEKGPRKLWSRELGDGYSGISVDGDSLFTMYELWRHPHRTEYGLNISTPVWGEGNLLFCSSAYNGGSRVLQLERKDGRTTAKELWFNNRMRIHIGNAIRVGDYVYGSSGDFGPAFVTAAEVKTGKIVWQDRSLAGAGFLYADGKFIILDEDGHLALATASPSGLKILSKVELLNRNAWTIPSLVGTRLYVRDRKVIMALELS